ncbi:hypothetical protein Back2_16970 [Nocardioides baekrokdamisoli]|uniref:Uncharacterized protein n=1 Tax=Nocardioides baekrokdamisoli TaxID=1804624 RepID=A0A3G9IEJ4_9ACTN|nr:hypothetical protein [Nocardioides baekrokdamisoli]BBH17410.1 hypothetical protein Back2_16970 [Nocardioides baekrokdamisoli]
MSDQMVPPPPPPPPSPSSGGGGFDANAAVDQFKGADPLDLAVVGAGVLALIFSWFSSFYTVHVSFAGYSAGGGTSAWHGFFGWAGVLLLLAASAVVAAKIVNITVPNEDLIVVGTSVVGLLFVLLALFVDVGNTGALAGTGISEGRGWSYWIVLILAIASGGISGMKFAKARGLMK